jgi:hypothetical protein
VASRPVLWLVFTIRVSGGGVGHTVARGSLPSPNVSEVGASSSSAFANRAVHWLSRREDACTYLLNVSGSP